jgi:hypothetical protein
MSDTLTTVERLALAKLFTIPSCNDETALPPESEIHVSFTADIEGVLSRGPSSTRAATNRARSVPTICLLLQELGCTREYAPPRGSPARAGSLQGNMSKVCPARFHLCFIIAYIVS